VLRALWKIDVYLISTLVNKSIYYYYYYYYYYYTKYINTKYILDILAVQLLNHAG